MKVLSKKRLLKTLPYNPWNFKFFFAHQTFYESCFLMYNPINMQVGDEQRLKDKDLREKNKKARYEVRYDVEDYTRKSGLAEQDRLN